MGEVVEFSRRPVYDKRRLLIDDYLRGQQILAHTIFHWKDVPVADGREVMQFLLHHLATSFRADDQPLQPRRVDIRRQQP